MDDRLYLAIYDKKRLEQAETAFSLQEEDYVCEVVIPCFELGEAGGFPALYRSRFSEIAGSLYRLDEAQLPVLDAIMAPDLTRHQVMAADEERLYNAYVYIAEDRQ